MSLPAGPGTCWLREERSYGCRDEFPAGAQSGMCRRSRGEANGGEFVSPPQAVSPQTASRQDGRPAVSTQPGCSTAWLIRPASPSCTPCRAAKCGSPIWSPSSARPRQTHPGTCPASRTAAWSLTGPRAVPTTTVSRAPSWLGCCTRPRSSLSATGQQVTLLPAKAVGARDPRWYPPTGQHSASWDQPRSWQRSRGADQPAAQDPPAVQDKPVPRPQGKSRRSSRSLPDTGSIDAAPLYFRLLVTGEPLTDEFADTSAAAALAAARAASSLVRASDGAGRSPSSGCGLRPSRPEAGPVAGLPSTTPIRVRPCRAASNSRQCRAASVYPVLMPTAPRKEPSRSLVFCQK